MFAGRFDHSVSINVGVRGEARTGYGIPAHDGVGSDGGGSSSAVVVVVAAVPGGGGGEGRITRGVDCF